MFKIIFPCAEARVIDLLFSDPFEKYTHDDISSHCNLDNPTAERVLTKLKLYNFIEEKNNKYYMKDSKTTQGYFIADNFCRKENNDTIHNIFESEKKEDFYDDIKNDRI